MRLHVFRLLAAFHGLFGLVMLSMLAVAFWGGLFENISTGRAILKIAGTAVGMVMLLACAWSSWKHISWTAPLAWAALAVFVVSAAGDEVWLHGINGFANLIPTFYVGTLVRAAAAAALGLLVLNIEAMPSAV